MTFTGFPVAALDFYDDLELDNTKSFWEAHKHVYAEAVKAPMTELTAALEPQFGPAKLFRPHRDIRFSTDKTPYKTHQGAYVGQGPACGWYVQLSAAGVLVGGGFYAASPANLSRIRSAIADQKVGPVVEQLVADAAAAGFEVGGETLKTAPRGFAVDHPRIALLRHKSLSLSRSYGFEPVINGPELVDEVRADWERLRPFVEWVAARIE